MGKALGPGVLKALKPVEEPTARLWAKAESKAQMVQPAGRGPGGPGSEPQESKTQAGQEEQGVRTAELVMQEVQAVRRQRQAAPGVRTEESVWWGLKELLVHPQELEAREALAVSRGAPLVWEVLQTLARQEARTGALEVPKVPEVQGSSVQASEVQQPEELSA